MPSALLRHAAETGLIADVEAWFAYHAMRNITSHTYDEENIYQMEPIPTEQTPLNRDLEANESPRDEVPHHTAWNLLKNTGTIVNASMPGMVLGGSLGYFGAILGEWPTAEVPIFVGAAVGGAARALAALRSLDVQTEVERIAANSTTATENAATAAQQAATTADTVAKLAQQFLPAAPSEDTTYHLSASSPSSGSRTAAR
jgi:Nucleotidyltransferase substrate binding protein like